jgi:hypothetical protein
MSGRRRGPAPASTGPQENAAAKQGSCPEPSAAAAPDVLTAPVVGVTDRNGSRYVIVLCPLCGQPHRHLHPGGRGVPVGARPAPCSPGLEYKPSGLRS